MTPPMPWTVWRIPKNGTARSPSSPNTLTSSASSETSDSASCCGSVEPTARISSSFTADRLSGSGSGVSSIRP